MEKTLKVRSRLLRAIRISPEGVGVEVEIISAKIGVVPKEEGGAAGPAPTPEKTEKGRIKEDRGLPQGDPPRSKKKKRLASAQKALEAMTPERRLRRSKRKKLSAASPKTATRRMEEGIRRGPGPIAMIIHKVLFSYISIVLINCLQQSGF